MKGETMNVIRITLIFLLLVSPISSLLAVEMKQNSVDSKTFENVSTNILYDGDFWEGAIGGLLFHELGHVLVGMGYGGNPQLNNGSIVYPNSQFSRKASMRVSSAGFQAQWLLSELSFLGLKDDDGWLNRRHYQGMIAMHIAISTAYLIRLKDMPTSDIYAASQASQLSRKQLAWVTFLPAALDAYRLMGEDVPDWVGHLSLGIKAAEVGYTWQF